MSRLLLVLLAAWTTGVSGEQRPPRAAQAPAGAMTGSVVDADTGRPVRFAEVALGGAADLGTVTDDAGTFAFESLSAGAYSLAVTAPGYLTTAYGQVRPGTQTRGIPVRLAAGERRDRLVIELRRGASIAGVVRDEQGAPLFGASVAILRWVTRNGRRELEQIASADSDERGAYRIPLLPPRRYVVVASSDRTIETAAGARGFATVRYRAAGAIASVALDLDEHRTDIDFELPLVPLARVTGQVFDEHGQPAPGTAVSLISREMGEIEEWGTTADHEGRFAFEHVRPGSHLLAASAGVPTLHFGPDGAVQLSGGSAWTVRVQNREGLTIRTTLGTFAGDAAIDRLVASGAGTATAAEMPVFVQGSETDVTLTLRPVRSVGGRIVSDGARLAAERTLQVELIRIDLRREVRRGEVAADGSFSIPSTSPGLYRVNVIGLPPPWTPESATASGVDALDARLEVRSDRDVHDLAITLTDRPASLTGAVIAGASPAEGDYTVILFAADERLWSAPTRVLAAGVTTDGRYTFPRVRPGDYRLAVVHALEPDEWLDWDFLREATASALPVRLTGGERAVQDVRVR